MRAFYTLMLCALATTVLYATQEKKTLKIQLQAQGGNLDQCIVYFDQSIQPTYNFQEDAQKVFSGVAGKPEVFTNTTDNISCSNNGFGTLANTEVVALGYNVDASGSYTISASQIDNFDPTSILRLEDVLNGTFIDLRNSVAQVTLNSTDSETGRFFIHITRPSVFSTQNADCQNMNGVINSNFDPSVEWTLINLYDNFNNPVGSFSNTTGAFDFTSLAEGDYHMVMAYGNYTTTQDFHINGNYVVADVSASVLTAETWQEINFFSNSTNSNQYEWDFGDGTLIVGVANPSLAYLSPGVYTVSMKASNQYGCSDNSNITVTIVEMTTGLNETETETAKVTAYGKDIKVSISEPLSNPAVIEVNNLIGQSVYKSSSDSQTTSVSLKEQPNGYYIVSVKFGAATTTKRVYLGS